MSISNDNPIFSDDDINKSFQNLQNLTLSDLDEIDEIDEIIESLKEELSSYPTVIEETSEQPMSYNSNSTISSNSFKEHHFTSAIFY